MWGSLSELTAGVASALASAGETVASLIEGKEERGEKNNKSVLLPWEDRRIPEARRGECETRVRHLSKHRRTFMEPFTLGGEKKESDSTDGGAFDVALAQRLLEVDANLSRWRWDLVPGKISEAAFWYNYLQRVELVKTGMLGATDVEVEHTTGGDNEEKEEEPNDRREPMGL